MNDIDINCNADVTAVCVPVSPRAARYSPTSGKHKPCKTKSRLGRFLPDFAETDGRYENKQEKKRWVAVAPTSYSQRTATPTVRAFSELKTRFLQGGLLEA